jgi:disulfide bond formation protein DsbB
MVRLPMTCLLKVVLVLVVLALVLVGLPIGMPMAPCPQCVLPAGAFCLLVALLATVAAVQEPDPAGIRAGSASIRLRARLWGRRLDRPPQSLPQAA